MILALAISWLAAPASAGAWMREDGTAFLSLNYTLKEDRGARESRDELGVFFEYGLNPKLTLGARGTLNQGETGEAHVFARVPVTLFQSAWQIATQLELGVDVTALGTQPVATTGLSFGRGMQWGERNGWTNVDAMLQWSQGGQTVKLDSTLGVDLSERLQIMGQLFLETDGDGQSATLAPSVIYRLEERTRVVVGVQTRVGTAPSHGISLGLWREF